MGKTYFPILFLFVLIFGVFAPEQSHGQRKGRKRSKVKRSITAKGHYNNPPKAKTINFHPSGRVFTNNDFPYGLKKGINISHWLSQSKKRGEERKEYFTLEDIRWISKVGFDHIRLPIDEEQLWAEDGTRNDTAFNLLDSALWWAYSNNLKVVLDLHIIRAHHFNDESNLLWTDKYAQTNLANLWKQLSLRYSKFPENFLAYEFMNEPVAPDHEQWNELIAYIHSELRRLEPNRWLVIGSNMWQGTESFPYLKIPKGDPNILLSFHYYKPFLLTHYKTAWTKLKTLKGRVNYPGVTLANADTAMQDEVVKKELPQHNRYWDFRVMEQDLEACFQLSKQMKLPLYCGEFGCYNQAPMPDKLRWYVDIRALLEKHKIIWSAWDYKGSFGIKSKEGKPLKEMVQVLLK